MFGGVNDSATAPADENQAVAHDGTLEGSQHEVVANNTAMPGYAPTDDASVAAPADDQAQAAPAPVDGGDLLSIKQQALQDLSPLVSHLEQSPEEKFRTTMMLIQASDNSDLIKEAYDAAQQIPDEKARAQALLDIVNEINYFTQHQEQQ
jgi:hypothetical protein